MIETGCVDLAIAVGGVASIRIHDYCARVVDSSWIENTTMSTTNQEIDFHGWSKKDIERGLGAMGCQDVSTSSLLLSGSKSIDLATVESMVLYSLVLNLIF